MPNFVLIGAQKAGTTAIAHYLSQHPQIYMSPMKEPGFFDFEGCPPNFKGPSDQDLYSHIITDLNHYLMLFDGVTDEVAIGEATTWYLRSPKAADRIHHYIPDAKLIAILRNPVDRAFSAYMHAVRDDREWLDFPTALNHENKRIDDNWEYLWQYRLNGLYSEQLSYYFSKFHKDQFRIYLYEDLCQDPKQLIRDIFSFLEVSDEYIPSVFSRLNISGKPKIKLLDNLLEETSLVKRTLKPLLPKTFRKQIANRLRMMNTEKKECPPEIRQELIAFFRDDILRTQQLIGRDLSNWLAA